MIFKQFNKEREYTQPTRATSKSAGYDLFVSDHIELEPNSFGNMVKTNTCLSDIGDNQFVQLSLRSSIGLKTRLRMSNGIGVIDADYPGEICFLIDNFSEDVVMLNQGDKLGQGVICVYYNDETEVNNKRTGGFGSTNKVSDLIGKLNKEDFHQSARNVL